MTVNANLAHDAQTNQSGHRVDGVVPTLIDAKVKGDALMSHRQMLTPYLRRPLPLIPA